MDAEAARGVTRFFDDLEDPRIHRTRAHKLSDIIMIAIVAILGDAEHWTEVELFGRSKEAEFRRFLALPNGIPSHDTFNRVFNRLDPGQLNRCFMRWVRHLAKGLGVQTVALDGKTLRGSADAAKDEPPLHLISAWAHEAGLVLGQLACAAKSNEITALPELIGMLELKGCLVTVDALNTQRDTAEAILEGEGDYVMALKTNQRKLHDDVVLMLAEAEDDPCRFALDEQMTEETGHGRTERRRCTTLKLGRRTWRFARSRWPGLKAIGRVIRERVDQTTGEQTMESVYYLLSAPLGAERFAAAVRGHWGIENSVNWVLDVTFDEDHCRCRTDHGDENFALLRRLALNLLRTNRERTKMTMKAQRRKIGWDMSFLNELLCHLR